MLRILFHKGKKKNLSGVVDMEIPETQWDAWRASLRAKMQTVLSSNFVS